jgi:TRAP-type C4-dicarboxylate transport system permease small subunit
MNAFPSRRASLAGFVPTAFSLVCAALMIIAALWKRGTVAGSTLHGALEWSIMFMTWLVMLGISVAAIQLRHPSRRGVQR